MASPPLHFPSGSLFLHDLARHAFETLRPGGYLALLLAAQTEKDLPAGFGYLDHAFLGYAAALRAGFLPERRISCPMDGAYLPQHVRRARSEGRLLGQVRDLLVMRKPSRVREIASRDPGHGNPLDRKWEQMLSAMNRVVERCSRSDPAP